MEQELIEHEHVSELQEVRNEISFHVQEILGENEYKDIEIDAEAEQIINLSRDGVLNEPIPETMLQESRQIVDDVSREQVMLLLLEVQNVHANDLKQNLKQMKTHHENLLELDLKPNVYEEEQHCSQIEMQLKNTETMINKLKAFLQDIERKHLNMQDQKNKLQQEYDARQKKFKALLDKKLDLLNKHNERIDQLKNKTDLSQLLERVNQLEDDLKLKHEQKCAKTEAADEMKKLENKIALQRKEMDEVNAKKNEVLLQLAALNTEMEGVKENKRQLLNKQVEVKEAVMVGEKHKMKIAALQHEIKLLETSIDNKKNSRPNFVVLREMLLTHDKENKSLRAKNQGVQQEIERIHEMLQTLQTLKEENYHNFAQKLEHEKVLLVETTHLTSVQNKNQIVHKQLEDELKISEELQQNIKNCKEKLSQTKQQFQAEILQLTECLNEHKKQYEKNGAYKVDVANKKDSDRNNNEEQIKSKLAEVENMKKEIEEAEEELEKTLQLVENGARLKAKLTKDKTAAENEYNAKYLSKCGVHYSLSDNVRGILKSPKKVTFEGLSSDISSSEPPSQDNSAASRASTEEHITLFDIICRNNQQNQTKKTKKSRLNSPERDSSF